MWLKCTRFKSRISKIISSRIMAKRFKVDENSTNHISTNDEVGLGLNNISEPEAVLNSSNMKRISENFTRLTVPNKSQADVKEYSVIKLHNDLTALLISDKSQIINIDDKGLSGDSSNESSESSSDESSCDEEDNLSDENEVLQKETRPSCEEKLAACALCIGVGSFSDPENIPGLAHFLEHMIFMGSEKYPKENEFDVFIKKKGGADNASTECEYTTFYFDCHEEHLHGAMEIFSQLFVSPLMKRDTMTKEREAIESEFQMALPSDESRKSQLLCSLADKTNPAHKFMWGNLITLRDNIKDDELYEAVHEFRKRYYSANQMTLAVQARLPIETLENWVVECFKQVPNNGLARDEFLLTVPPFEHEEFSKLYIVEPVKNINHLNLTWVMPPTLQMYKSKPLQYLSWVIGHEGSGSLLSYLRKKLWSFGLTVSSGGDGTEENSIYTLFSISLSLTHEGIKNVEDILNSVFDYIKMLQNTGPQERLFHEMKLIAETSFRFSEEIPSSDNVEQLSENMHFYPPSDYITGVELFFEYDPQLIKSFLSRLRADNVNVMISSKLIAATENLEKIEPWFGTKYQPKEIPPHWIKNWQGPITNEEFHLPEENPFITSDFTILPAPNNPDMYPKNIIKDDVLELWFKQDVTFKLPHAFCCFHLRSPLPFKSPQNAAMLDLFISILKQSLVEELYPANVAQLEYGFYSGEKGIVISISGFNEKLKLLLKAIIKGMISLSENLKPDMVLTMKDELKRGYSNSNLKTSFLAREIRMSILLKTYWTSLDKERALGDVTFHTLNEFIAQYFKHLHIQCLIQGNISKDEAIELGQIVQNGLSCKPLLVGTARKIQVNQLPPGEKYCVVHSFNAEDANSVVTNYYQSGLGTIRESCIIELLLMIMEEPLFDSLRTNQQLGYDVSCTLRDTFGILGFSISVHCQSDRNKVEFVESRITEFLNTFLKTLKETSLDEFKEIQESLMKLKNCVDIHLKEEVKRNWDEIKSEEYVFDRHHKEREYIGNLTLEEVIKWFEDTSGISEPSKCRKLSTQVVGKVPNSDFGLSSGVNDRNQEDVTERKLELNFLPQQDTSDKFIFNVKDFKESLSLYPFHKINK